MLILGVDTGGTFTDFVLQSESGLQTYKLPSTPDDPSRAILQGLDHFFGNKLPTDLEIIHGSTVATNAFLERKGAKTLLVTTYGFEDILFIGRQNRPKLYDFNVTRPREIIPRSMVVGGSHARAGHDRKATNAAERTRMAAAASSAPLLPRPTTTTRFPRQSTGFAASR